MKNKELGIEESLAEIRANHHKVTDRTHYNNRPFFINKVARVIDELRSKLARMALDSGEQVYADLYKRLGDLADLHMHTVLKGFRDTRVECQKFQDDLTIIEMWWEEQSDPTMRNIRKVMGERPQPAAPVEKEVSLAPSARDLKAQDLVYKYLHGEPSKKDTSPVVDSALAQQIPKVD